MGSRYSDRDINLHLPEMIKLHTIPRLILGFIRMKAGSWWFCMISEDSKGKGKVEYVAPVKETNQCQQENQVCWAKIENGIATLE